jgi:hypothetical protein
MKIPILGAILAIVVSQLIAQQPSASKPPVGVPADATLFNGKWYRVYLERATWKAAKTKCERLGGQLAIVPDETTHAFIRALSKDLELWLGGFEKLEGLWEWVDGTPMNFKGWAATQPDAGYGLQMLKTWRGGWGDTDNADRGVIGYICEWKAK